MNSYKIITTETGDHIRTFNSYSAAIDALYTYEQKDRNDGVFEDNYYRIVDVEELTYDIVFNCDEHTNNKGVELSLNDAYSYISFNMYNKWSYFQDYIGGTVSIVNNETGDTIYTVIIE
jgi:hypothetical protein